MTNKDDSEQSEGSQDQIRLGNVFRDAVVAVGRGARAIVLRVTITITDSHLWPFIIALLLVIAGLIYYLLQPDIPDAMAGEFNVAVAEFIVVDEEGKLLRSDEGQEVAQWLFGRLYNTFSELGLQHYELWAPAYTGQITGESKEEREQAAQALAERIKAHVIIYGVITERQDARSELVMEFYVNSKGFEEGEEITGQHELGKALEIMLPFDATDLPGVENPALSARSQALALLTLGLAHYTTDDFEEALGYFEQAEAVEGWFQNAGKEVLYLLLGNSNSRIASVDKLPEYLSTNSRE